MHCGLPTYILGSHGPLLAPPCQGLNRTIEKLTRTSRVLLETTITSGSTNSQTVRTRTSTRTRMQTTAINWQSLITWTKIHHHHHHHRDAKRSAVASRRCDLSPSVFCQLQSIGHRYFRVPADLMNPGGERSTSSTPPVGHHLELRSRSEGSGLLGHHLRVWQRD